MRATILPYVIVLTKAHRAAVCMIARGSIGVFLIFTTQIYSCYAIIM